MMSSKVVTKLDLIYFILLLIFHLGSSFHIHHVRVVKQKQRPQNHYERRRQVLALIRQASWWQGSRNTLSHNKHQHKRHTPLLLAVSQEEEEEVDVVVIGAGIGGLSCGALSAKYGFDTLVLEAHDTAGGVAHSFTRYSSASKTVPFQFDSGPSLISGLSSMGTNPLRQVLDAIGTADTEITWKTYDGWIVHDISDSTSFKLTTGDGGEFEQEIEKKAGTSARQEFEQFKAKMLEKRGLSEASGYIPPFALRSDIKAAASLFKYTLKLLSIGSNGALLTGPFGYVIKNHTKQIV